MVFVAKIEIQDISKINGSRHLIDVTGAKRPLNNILSVCYVEEDGVFVIIFD